MLTHRIYYSLKPYLPWRLRIGVRRVLARRQRAAHQATWPIDPAAGRKPEGWPGWPDGKQFAFVLTHDVEDVAGLQKVRMLAELEQENGFRSTFNFIPEGPYQVPTELRESLVRNGFEVGVHDLRHDGRLFASRAKFEQQARRINQHLRGWGARGFRSGFMLRNLDWLQQLDVEYDASTFDTDPFEPQSEGAGTIFPFWVDTNTDSTSDCHRGGYLELPYTLPQDSTLFLLLREKSPEIWLRKLDWIAEHGGMALLNVHPDYLQFPGEAPSPRTFPVSHYVELLDYVRRRYGTTYWQPVAGELSSFARQFKPSVPRRRRRIGMVTHSFYENDNRVIRYATALAARGDQVDVLALRRSDAVPVTETIDGVRVHRILGRSGKQEKSKFAYLWSWLSFLRKSAWWFAREYRQTPFDLLHVHNMPDFLVYSAWYPRLRGTKVILDIHDITPEFYTSKFGARGRTLPARILEWTERKSATIADHVIISNHLWLEKYAERTGTGNRCSVFINNVNTDIFRPHPRRRNDNRKLIIFPGGLQWHQGLDIAIKAMPRVLTAIPNAEFHIYGDGNMKPALIALVGELGLADKVRFFEPVDVKHIAKIMADADVGVVPKRADSFGNEAYSTKIMEFMSVGVPVVISSTKIDRFYFDDTVARFFESGNEEALASGLIEVLTREEDTARMVENARDYANQHSWSSRQNAYFRIVDTLTVTGSAACELGTATSPLTTRSAAIAS